jgi:hypothetical protein
VRLLNTETLELEEFFENDVPPYAVLSHRWGKQEISLQELVAGAEHEKDGYTKIEEFCSLARSEGYSHGWCDTCCIDKTSSAELSEAINSMYRWYEESEVCYAYLADVGKKACWGNGAESFRKSVWFTRGWTLQELLAPNEVVFFTKEWIRLGTKEELSDPIAAITAIPIPAIVAFIPSEFCAAQKLSWAANRTTTRREDEAYCLLGVLGVHMSLLYGEGTNAFRRIQEEVKPITEL